jgi:apolipoprotein N-acyltransferase
MAIWGGVYAVGFFGLLCISIIYHWYQSPQYSERWLKAALLLVVVYGYSWHALPGALVPATIAFVQTASLPPQQFTDLSPLVETALATGASYVLLPEDSRYLTEGYRVSEVGATEAIATWRLRYGTSTALIIDSGRTTLPDTGVVVQRAYLWDQQRQFETDKTYLVPQGEYMPNLYTATLRAFGLGVAADALGSIINYTPGTLTIDRHAPRAVPNILFCFESVSPLAARRLQKERPSDFIVHPMSHSWFHQPGVLWQQLETMLRFQAVYAGVPIVSVGNDVRGSVYLPDGSIVQPETVATFAEGTVDIVRPLP